MSLETAATSAAFKDFQRNPKDTGSPEVQIALITERVNYLTEHFKIHKNDRASRLGLMRLVSQRRKLLDYLHSVNTKCYQSIIEKLDLRG